MYIAVICSPFASHLGRMISLFRQMVDDGHRIELWGADRTAALAAANGLGFREIPLKLAYPDAASCVSGAGEYYTEVAFPMAREQVPHVVAHCEQSRPDVLYSNTRVYAAAIASNLTGIPVVNHCCSGNSFAQIPEDLYGFAADGTESDARRSLMLSLSRRFHESMDQWFNENISAELGLPDVTNAIGMSSRSCVLVHSVAELSNPRISALPQTRFIGPLVETLSQCGRQSSKGSVYVSLGTWPIGRDGLVELYKTVLKGIPKRMHVEVGLGGVLSPAELGVEDSTVVLHEYAPQLELIRKSDVVICHGGCQTVHESLYYGKPVIGISLMAEHKELMRKVVQANSGVMLNAGNLTPADVGDAVEKTDRTRSVADAAVHMGERLREVVRAARIEIEDALLDASIAQERACGA